MSKEIREKQKELQNLINSKKELEKSYQESKRALEEAITIEEARQRCRNGEITMSEYKAFKDQRDLLETVVEGNPGIMAELSKFIQKSQNELNDLKRNRNKKLVSRMAVLLLCVISLVCGYVVCDYLNKQELPAYQETAYKDGYARGSEAARESAYYNGWNDGYDTAAELAKDGVAVSNPVIKEKAIHDLLLQD